MNTRNVLEWLEDAARLSPDAIAFDGPGKGFTWNQVRHTARSIGSFLAARMKRQQPVLILMEKRSMRVVFTHRWIPPCRKAGCC